VPDAPKPAASPSAQNPARPAVSRRHLGGALLTLWRSAPAAVRRRPRSSGSDVAIPPLHELRVPKPETYVLPNGLRVFLLEDRAHAEGRGDAARPHRRRSGSRRTSSVWLRSPDK
jgi:hypothetical protein